MAYIDISHDHQLEHGEVKQLADEIAAELCECYSMEYAWEDGILYFERSGAYGQIEIDDKDIRVQAELSFPLNLMQNRIEAEINKVLKKHFAD